MAGMGLSAEERKMCDAIDRSVPRLHKLTEEMRARGEDFTADEVAGIIDDLSASRPAHDVFGCVVRTAA